MPDEEPPPAEAHPPRGGSALVAVSARDIGRVSPLPARVRDKWRHWSEAQRREGPGASGASSPVSFNDSGKRFRFGPASPGSSPPRSKTRYAPEDDDDEDGDGPGAWGSSPEGLELQRRLDRAAAKRAEQLRRIRAKAGREEAKVCEARRTLDAQREQARARLEEALDAAATRRQSLEGRRVQRLTAWHQRVFAKVRDAEARLKHEQEARKLAMHVRLLAAAGKRREALERRRGAPPAGGAPAPAGEAAVRARLAAAACEVQRAWRAFRQRHAPTADLARAFAAEAGDVLREPPPPPAAAAAAAPPPAAWLHDPADAARAEAFEAFAGALQAPGLNRACVAILARVAALHLRVKASESRPPVADLGGVLRGLSPKAAAAGKPLERYPARVFLSCFMICSFPEVVFNSMGTQEDCLRRQAVRVRAEFLALLAGLRGRGGAGGAPFKAADALHRFDAAWANYLQEFVAWKTTDAATLVHDLVAVACQMQRSLFEKCGCDLAAPRVRESHDLSAMVEQVATDHRLIAERVERLAGPEGGAALRAQLAEVRQEAERKQLHDGLTKSAKAGGGPAAGPDAATAGDDAGALALPQKDVMLWELLHDPEWKFDSKLVEEELDVCVDGTLEVGKLDETTASLHEYVKKTVEKGFWDSIQESLQAEPPSLDKIAGLLVEVGEDIMSVVPRSAAGRARFCALGVAEALDVLDAGAGPWPRNARVPGRLVGHLRSCVELLLFLGAPAREEGLKARFEALTGQLAAAADAPGTAHKLCMTLRFIFFLVRLIKIDIANAHLRTILPLVNDLNGVEEGRDRFRRRHGVEDPARPDLPKTAQWLGAGLEGLRRVEAELFAAVAAYGGAAGGAVAPAPPMQTGLGDPGHSGPGGEPHWLAPFLHRQEAVGSATSAFIVGLAEMLQQEADTICPAELPEVFDLDHQRILQLQARFQDLAILAFCGIALQQKCPALTADPAALARQLDRVARLLKHQDTSMSSISLELAAIVNQHQAAPQTDEEAMKVLLGRLVERGSAFNAVQRNLARALAVSAVCGVGSGGAKHAGRPYLQRIQAVLLADRVEELAAQLKQTALVSGLVHADVFAALAA